MTTEPTSKRPATKPSPNKQKRVTTLGNSQHPVASAQAYLANAPAASNSDPPPVPPRPSAVLSRVMASAERLEMELAHAVAVATHDAVKAAEAARLETLRAHLSGLREAGRHCQQLQRLAEGQAATLTAELASCKLQGTHDRQEISRLRWQLSMASHKTKPGASETAVMAFLGGGAKKGGGAAGALMGKLSGGGSIEEQMRAAMEREAWQAQLDETAKESESAAKQLAEMETLADDVAQTLKQERTERAAAEAATLAKLDEATAKATKNEQIAKNQVSRLKFVEKQLEQTKQSLAKARASMKFGKAAAMARAGAPGLAAVANGAKGAPATAEAVVPRSQPMWPVGADGVVLDADGKPMLDDNGQPVHAPGANDAPDGSDGAAPAGAPAADTGAPAAVAGADGNSSLYGGSHMVGEVEGHGRLSGENGGENHQGGSLLPPGGSIGPGGVILDAQGDPVLGADGKPVYLTDANMPPGGSIGPGGVILDSDGKPVLRSDGTPMYADPRIPPGGSVSADGMLLDANGRPVLGADGLPLCVLDARIPPGGSVGPAGRIFGPDGELVRGSDGKPIYINPRVPPGGSVREDGTILDADGKPVLDANGLPLHSDPRIPPGGSAGAGGVILDANGKPVLDANGQPMHMDVRVPPGGSIGADGLVLDAEGNPVVGPDGSLLYSSSVKAASAATPATPGGGSMSARKPKKVRKTGAVVPAGRLVIISKLRARDVPDMDRSAKSGKMNVSDPYLTFAAMDDNGEELSYARIPHVENARNPKWEEDVIVRLFLPDDEASGSKTKDVAVKIRLFDHDKGDTSKDDIIGDVFVKLKAGHGKMKVELASRSPSPCRPMVYFRYEVSPQMFFEQAEYARVSAEDAAEDAADDGKDDD